MKAIICDVCYEGDGGKMIEGEWKIGRRSGISEVKLDVCGEHKNWGKDLKTPKEFAKAALELFKIRSRSLGA